MSSNKIPTENSCENTNLPKALPIGNASALRASRGVHNNNDESESDIYIACTGCVLDMHDDYTVNVLGVYGLRTLPRLKMVSICKECVLLNIVNS